MQHDDKVCIARRATFGIQGEVVHCEERVCSARKGCAV